MILPEIKPNIVAAKVIKSMKPPARPSKPSIRLIEFVIPTNHNRKIPIIIHFEKGRTLPKKITDSTWGKN